MIINDELLDKITAEAQASPRLRMNFNLHDNLDAKAQRLINVLLPCTILPIHTSETYLLLRGKMFVLFYNEVGAQIERYFLDHTTGNYGVHIPKGQWHTVEVIEPSAILEVKEGPYTPLSPEDIMD